MSTDTLTIRLLVTVLPDLPEAGGVDIGIQDKTGQVHAGQALAKGGMRFVCEINTVQKSGGLDFRGPCVHGGPGERFIYLSWKRRSEAPSPWVQRVKIPLTDLEAAWDPAKPIIEADITGRRPHEVRPILWRTATR